MGQDENPLAQVGSSNALRTETAPLSIEPQRGQGSENVSEPGSKEPWHVFQKDDSGLHLANHALDVWPQPPFVISATPGSGDADRLAREARRDDIHDATPRSSIEVGEVVPHRRSIHGLVLHPRQESGRGESVPLNETHGTVAGSEGEGDSEFEPSNPGT